MLGAVEMKAVLAVNHDVPEALREALDAGLDPLEPIRGKTLVASACVRPSYGILELLAERCPEALFAPAEGIPPFILALMRPSAPDVERLAAAFASALPDGVGVEGLCGPGTTPLAEIEAVGDDGWDAGRKASELLVAMGHPPLPDKMGPAAGVGMRTV